ncbi:MAG: hypothetical protein DDT22_00240 [candidate division WS2 bacterium]|nr:hypothetical protein [Candidatus Lithacetigena glycinireducens]
MGENHIISKLQVLMGDKEMMRKLLPLFIALIIFLASLVFVFNIDKSDPEVITHDKQTITVKELAFEVQNRKQFFLNIDNDWQLGFESIYLKDSKGRSRKVWLIKKYKRTL